MNDDEMLAFAAKAAGLSNPSGDDDIWYDSTLGHDVQWVPLEDDGDALRLAVKLNLDLMLTRNHGKFAEYIYAPMVKESGFPEEDAYAATRRAIVKVAAAIGRAMP